MVVRWFSKIITEVELNGFALVNRYKKIAALKIFFFKVIKQDRTRQFYRPLNVAR